MTEEEALKLWLEDALEMNRRNFLRHTK